MPSGKKVAIKYTSRDFDSIKRDLVNYARKYYPSTYQDFSEAGFGSLLTDMVSYVGDMLSFYVDFQANESYLDTAVEYDNVVRLARQIGYKMNVNPSSYGIGTFYIIVPASSQTEGPDEAYIPVLKRGTLVSSIDGAGFVLNEDVDFANSSNQKVVSQVNAATGLPTSFAIQAFGQVASGRLVEQNVVVGDFQRFYKAELIGTDITEVVSIQDYEGNDYYEVDYLSQNTIYKSMVNPNTDDREQAPALVKAEIVPRRFIVERVGNKTFVQFGAGDEASDINSAFTEPSSVVLFQNGRDYITDTSVDPTRLLDSNKLGIAPANTTLRIVYRVNSSANVNASAGSLTGVDKPLYAFENIVNLSPTIVKSVSDSLEVTNESPIVGDISLPSITELKLRAPSAFASQNRAVTRQDYLSLMYSMPERFGVIKKGNIVQDDYSFRRNLNAYIISEDKSGNLALANSSLKNNLKMWLNKNKMITDSIDILDGKIVNFGIEFEAVGKMEEDNVDLLSQAVGALSVKFNRYYDMSENLYISDIYSTLKEVDGILDVVSAKVVLKIGSVYSGVYFDMRENLSVDGRMIKIPQNVVLELKYPNVDITGVIR
jgi:hypothetical protein